MNQTTLRDAVHFAGIGLHTGADVAVTVRPAAVNAGISFLAGATRIPATAEHVVDTARATVLGAGDTTISTVEHVLSALFGMGIANAEIVVEGPEIPVVDGSAKAFSDAFAGAGVVDQGVPRDVFRIDEPFALREDDRAVVLLPGDAFRVRFVADFPSPVGAQYLDTIVEPERYREEIAPARTFGFLHEVQALRSRGLARGGTLENAIVFGPDGPLQPLRWPDEVVRHKVLDLLGDVALLGAWPACDLIAVKSGHATHVRAMRALRDRAAARVTARSA